MPLHMIGNSPRYLAAYFAANAAGFKRPQVIVFAQQIWSPGAYIDGRKLASHPAEWEKILGPVIGRARELRSKYDVIASVATGGIIHGGAIARELRVPHVIVKKGQKSHGLDGRIDGDTALLQGAKVLLVEDTSSTLTSALNMEKVLVHEGAQVAAIITLSTWNFPEFQRNVQNREVHTVCTGLDLLNYARSIGTIDPEHEDIVRHWIEHPEDKRWVNDKWVFPQ